MEQVVEAINSFLNSINSVGLAGMLSGLGLTTALLAFLKWSIDRYRWAKFKRKTDGWLNALLKAQHHPKEFEDMEWQAIGERLLTESFFTPTEIVQLLGTAVLVMKGLAADKVFM